MSETAQPQIYSLTAELAADTAFLRSGTPAGCRGRAITRKLDPLSCTSRSDGCGDHRIADGGTARFRCDADRFVALRAAVTAKAIEKHLNAFSSIATMNGGTRASGTPGYDASLEYAWISASSALLDLGTVLRDGGPAERGRRSDNARR